MAIDLLLDKNTHDLIIEDGDLKLTDSKPTVLRQRMTITFRTFVNEWFANTFFGGINKEIIFNKLDGKGTVDSWFIKVINSFEEVNQIVKFDSTFDRVNRHYDLSFTVKTDEGILTLYVQAGQAISYPYDEQTSAGVVCDPADPEYQNRFYVLIHEEIPDPITWVTGQHLAENAMLSENGHNILDESADFMEQETPDPLLTESGFPLLAEDGTPLVTG